MAHPNSASNPYRTIKSLTISPYDQYNTDDDDRTHSEVHAKSDCDGSFDIELDDAVVNVYYWVTRPGGRLVQPEIELEAYDRVTGDPYEFSADDEERAIRYSIEDWVEQGDGAADYYRCED